jgi:hypothetical protein
MINMEEIRTMRPTTNRLIGARFVESTNRNGSSRFRITRLLGLTIATTVWFTLALSPLQAQPSCNFADVNGDGVVDDADLLQVLFCFGTQTAVTIPSINEMVGLRLASAFPASFPAAPEVPFDPQSAAFVRVRPSRGGSRHDIAVAWCVRSDLEQFTPDQIASGLVVGAVYLPPGGAAPDGTRLSEGFYLVYMYSQDGTNWFADLREPLRGRPIVTIVRVTAWALTINDPNNPKSEDIKVRWIPAEEPPYYKLLVTLSYGNTTFLIEDLDIWVF